jgi:flavin reductase (DIM6/NTAB) family NADH-FMN oxidoreductase RutF
LSEGWRFGRVPRYVTIGDRDPQQQVRVTLETPGSLADVTRNHVVASLRPLRIAIGGGPQARGRLRFSPQADDGTTLGEVWLAPDGALAAGGATFQLYRVERHAMSCMPLAARAAYTLLHEWAELGHKPSFRMARADRLAFEVLYVCPRPVVLVSVEHEGVDNLFPMDLIGPADGPHFLMALRSTSRSITLMTGSGRMALADVPLEDSAVATRLGDRHSKVSMDWDALPFRTDRSPAHGLRVPVGALRVREVVIRDAQPAGSHTLFVTEVVAEQRRREGLQMFTVSGPYYRYLRVRGVRPPQP